LKRIARRSSSQTSRQDSDGRADIDARQAPVGLRDRDKRSPASLAQEARRPPSSRRVRADEQLLDVQRASTFADPGSFLGGWSDFDSDGSRPGRGLGSRPVHRRLIPLGKLTADQRDWLGAA
jgi:hypothetical protein